jgi:hypothetical protein
MWFQCEYDGDWQVLSIELKMGSKLLKGSVTM